ncbi:MAG: tRNA pseudouridine(55) synthase TruB [Granulosicoccus sp.]|nr:tRNA pseudouridine(55) synthase TruB [Granulosicoccus sp.]
MARNRKGRPVHGILLLDKPSGSSSNRVLQLVKRQFQARKAGHTGSLDPLATGMLPVCFGEATKISAYLLDAAKGYEVTMKLGVTTDSADSDGRVLDEKTVPKTLDKAGFVRICEQYKGPIDQIPPMVSAIKIDGQRLYKLARQGKQVERPSRSVTIYALDVLSFDSDVATLYVHCSKGTYIRSLVTDIGQAIGCGAHVTALRRLFVAPFNHHTMIDVPSLEAKAPQINEEAAAADASSWQALDATLLPVDSALEHLSSVFVKPGCESAFAIGQSVHGYANHSGSGAANGVDSPVCRVYSQAGQLLGLGNRESNASASEGDRSILVSPRRVFQWH